MGSVRPVAIAILGTLATLSLSSSAVAQETGGAKGSGLTMTPRLSVTETWTDNNNLQGAAKDAALITILTPGINVSSRTGRLRGSLDYSLNNILYIKSEQKNRTQQALTAAVIAELVEKTLFIDAQASISQQAASAFGLQSQANTANNSNRNEVAALTLSPYLRGQLAGIAAVELRGNAAETNAKNTIAGDTRTTGGSLNFSSLSSGPLGWWATAMTQHSTFKAGTSHRNTSANIGLRYRPDVDVQLGVNVGRERNDLAGNGNDTSAAYGLNGTWSLSPRTTLAGDWQHHTYGNSHSLNFDHRMARSAWRFSDSQSVTLGGVGGAGGLRSNYDLLFLQYASQEPDPVRRDALVRSSLQTLGLSPDAISTLGFLSASPTLQRRQDLSFSLQGLRTTVTAMVSRSNSRRLGAATAAVDDFSQSATIVQRSVSLNLLHRLTPDSNVSLSLSQQESRGTSAALSTTLRSVLANWSGRLGRRLSVSLGARHTGFDGATKYSENAVFATLIQQF